MSHPVFLIASQGLPRDHHALFMELNHSDGSGQLFHVTGNIQNGMVFEKRTPERPKQSATFVDKKLVGWVHDADVGRFEQVCRSNPPPEKQFDGPRRLDPGRKLRRCQEWTAEMIRKLRAEGVIYDKEAASGNGSEASNSGAAK
ncbi:hypothetical protein GE09DRAFT_1192073 [Coniochaeta sp. 2T2.1]|nr:hypothetical protein GE09DRAFT_1192073 [Coniochaeta sp. 2T2.1]